MIPVDPRLTCFSQLFLSTSSLIRASSLLLFEHLFESSRAMENFQLEDQLCLNSRAVPIDFRHMEFEDLHGVAPEDIEEGMHEVECLNLKTTMPALWFTEAFKLHSRWWVANATRVPLVQEISEAIRKPKIIKGGDSRLSKKPKIFVAIQIRGKVITVQNTSNPVTLVAPAGKLRDLVWWFLAEFAKDLDDLLGEPRAGASKSSSSSSSKRKAEWLKDFEAMLQPIRDHAGCRSTCFIPANGSIKVVKSTEDQARNEMKNVYLGQWHKKRKAFEEYECDENYKILENCMATAVDIAIKFLDQPPRSEDGQRAHEEWAGSRLEPGTLPLGGGLQPLQDSQSLG